MVEHVERLVPGVAGVDHEREIEPMGESDLRCECLALDVPWRVVVVVVQPCLADGDDPGVAEQIGDGVDPVSRLVRMEPDGCPHVVVGLGGRDRLQAGGAVAPDGDHRHDAGIAGRPHGRVGAARHPFVVDVAVRVEDVVAARALLVAVGGHAVMRGKSGSPLVTVRPPG